jgi:hypothetical protein
MRQEYGLKGLGHVRRWHDAGKVAQILTSIYESAPPTKPGGNRKRRGTPSHRARYAEVVYQIRRGTV